MIEQIARYLIGALVGAAIAWMASSHWHGQKLRAWEQAAATQQAEERARIAKHNERIVHGWAAAVDHLRARLDAGWRPGIPRSASLPAGGVPGTSGRTDGRPADDVPAAAGTAGAAATGSDLAQCRADLDRLIADGAETTLQVRAWQSWALGLPAKPTKSPVD